MSCYIVQEVDGASRFTLEDDSGFLLLEFCPPVGGEYNPVGDRSPGLLTDLPVRRSRRRRREMILAEEDDLLVAILDEL